jgi:uncharacterized membrane protein YesL
MTQIIESEIMIALWGIVVLLVVVAEVYYFYALKKFERTLWESFGKPSLLNTNGFVSQIKFLLSGEFNRCESEKFIKACKYLIATIILFLFTGILVFGLWPLTWGS